MMTLSPAGLALLKSFESCKLDAYQDDGGVWTIGWGHTGPEVTSTTHWTQTDADMVLWRDLWPAIEAVNTAVKVSLSQGQFDALVDFVYNCGVGAFESSTMLKLLNAGDYDEAADQFEAWDHVHGVVIAGLLRRRIAEEKEFDGDVV